MRKTKKELTEESINETKKLIDDVKSKNGISVTDILNVISGKTMLPSTSDEEGSYIPINTLKEIRSKLGEKVKTKDDDGNEILAPLYNEEEKTKLIFAMLAERGINLLDHLESCLASVGFNTSVVISINETMSKVAEMMRDIGEMQYRKSKLENERTNLEIQKYKADLKKRELDIKEKVADQGPSNTNIIAVGSTADLLSIMEGRKGIENIKEIPTNKVDEDDDNG